MRKIQNLKSPKNQNSKTPTEVGDVPVWVWNAARIGLAGLVIGIVGLAVAVVNGVADPQPVGRLQWEDHFNGEVSWATFGEGVEIRDRGLEIGVSEEEIGGAVTPNAEQDFSFEVAGGQLQGEVGAMYGIVFGYQSPTDYTAALINGNGYVEVITAAGREWLPQQQWPNILVGYEANRVRVDVENGFGLIRINDEVLQRLPMGSGRLGVMARGTAAAQLVRFGWARYWRK